MRMEGERDRETGNQTEGKFSFGIFKKLSEAIATKKDADAISKAALTVFTEYSRISKTLPIHIEPDASVRM